MNFLGKIFESSIQPATVNSGSQNRNNNTSSQYTDGLNNGISIPASGTDGYTFKKRDNIYYFGTKSQLAVRNVKSIPLLHRSIELLSDPETSGRTVGRTVNTNFTSYNSGFNSNNNLQQQSISQQQNTTKESKPAESILTIIPEEVKKDLGY